MLTLPRAYTAGHVLDGPSFLLQLLSHVHQILPVVPVCILQKLVARHKGYSKYAKSSQTCIASANYNKPKQNSARSVC